MFSSVLTLLPIPNIYLPYHPYLHIYAIILGLNSFTIYGSVVGSYVKVLHTGAKTINFIINIFIFIGFVGLSVFSALSYQLCYCAYTVTHSYYLPPISPIPTYWTYILDLTSFTIYGFVAGSYVKVLNTGA